MPNANAGSDTAICSGDSACLTAAGSSGNGPFNYSWNTAATNVSLYVNPSSPSTYSVTVSDVNGCEASSDVNVSIHALPIVNAGVDNAVCYGDSILIDASLSVGTPALTYNWNQGVGSGISHYVSPSNTTVYTVTVTDGNSCYASDDIQITVNPLPIPVVSSDTSVCNGTEAFLDAGSSTGNSPFTYAWSPGISNTNSSQTVIPVSNTTYVVTVTDINACSSSEDIVVNLFSLPLANAGQDIDLCLGDSVAIDASVASSGTPSLSYYWDQGLGVNASHVVSPSTTTLYTVTVIDGNTCKNSDSLYVFVKQLPVADFDMGGVCVGYPSDFLDMSTGIDAGIQDWYWDFDNGGLSTIQNPQTQYYYSTGIFDIILAVTDSNGCKDTLQKSVEIFPLPTASFNALQACYGDSSNFLDLTIPVGGIDNWHWDFGDIGNADTSDQQNPAYVFSCEGYFDVTLDVTDSNGCIHSYTTQVGVDTLPVASFNATNVPLGSPTTFTDLSVPNANTISNWLWNFGDGTSSIMQNPVHNYSQDSTYQVLLEVTNSSGCADTVSNSVTVYPLPGANFIADNVCFGDATQFTDMSTAPVSLASWVWSFGDGDSSFLQNPVHQYSSSGTYIVNLTVTDSANGVSDKTDTVHVYQLPQAGFSSDSVCLYHSTSFTDLSVSPFSIQYWSWDFGDNSQSPLDTSDQQNPLFLYDGTGNYQVKLWVRDSHGCEDTVSNQVYVKTNPVALFSAGDTALGSPVVYSDLSTTSIGSLYTWSWDFGDNSSFSFVQNPTYYYTWADTFNVKLVVSNTSGCIDSVEQPVIVYPLPGANFIFENKCFGDSVNFTDVSSSSVGIASWQWDFGYGSLTSSMQHPSHLYQYPGDYYVELTITDSIGGVISKIDTITIYELPVAGFYTDSVCYGSYNQFTDTSQLSGSITNWHWDFGDILATDTSSLQHPQYIYTDSGTYQVVLFVEDIHSCSDYDTSAIFVRPKPIADFTTNNVSFGFQTPFTYTGTTPVLTYQWDFGDGTPFSNLQNPTHLYPYPNTFYAELVVENDYACFDTVIHPTTVYPLPGTSFVADSVCLNDSTHFTDLTTPAGTATLQYWNWSFGDGGISSLQHPSHLYANPGVYYVTLIVTDSYGSSSSHSDSVIVYPNPTVNFKADSACDGDHTYFTDLSSVPGGNIIDWDWDFGDGIGIDSVQYPNYIYASNSSISKYQVSLSVTDNHGCTTQGMDSVITYPLPLPLFTQQDVCSEEFMSFVDASYSNGGQISQWSWDFGDGSGISTNQNPDYLYNAVLNTTNYAVELEVTDVNGCENTFTDTVTLYPLPLPAFTAATICSGDTTFFTDNSGSTGNTLINWFWDFGDGSGTSVMQDPQYIYSPVSSITQFPVQLIVVDGNQCRDTLEQQFTVNPKPVVDFLFDTACTGDITHFTDSSYSNGGYLISWNWNFGNNNNSSANQHPDFQYPNVLNVTQYEVSLLVEDVNQCYDSVKKWITVNPLPVPQFVFDTVCNGFQTNFTDLSYSNGGNIVEWDWDFGNNNDSSDLSNPAYVYPHITNPTNYQVNLEVRDANFCVNDVSANVFVYPQPVADYNYSKACYGKITNFYDLSYSNGGNLIGWNWDFNAYGNSFQEDPGFVFPSWGPNLTTLIVTDTNGCMDTVSYYVNVDSLPIPGFSYSNPCVPGIIDFTDLSDPNGDIIISWQWDFGDFSSSTQQSPAHFYPAVDTSYLVSLVIENTKGCSDTISDTIDVFPILTIDFTATTECLGDSTHFFDTILSAGMSMQSILWDFGDGTTSTMANPLHMYSFPGSYNVTLSITNQYNCTASVSKTVTVRPLPNTDFTYITDCVFDPTQFFDNTDSAYAPAIAWEWDFGDGSALSFQQNPIHAYNVPGIYPVSLQITDLNLCTHTFTQQVLIDSLPVADFVHDSACLGNNVHFTDVSYSSNDFIITWNWDFGDSTTSTQQNPMKFYLSPGTFNVTLIVENSRGCFDTVAKSIYVHLIPDADFTFSLACYGDTTFFTDLTNPTSTTISTWYWDFGDGNSSNLPNPYHIYALSGSYTVKLVVGFSNGCLDSVSKSINVFPSPNASFQYTASCNGSPTLFFDNSNGVGSAINSWQWNFDDPLSPLNTSTSQFPSHTYANSGNYIVSLTVTNSLGCDDSVQQGVVVYAEPIADFITQSNCDGQLIYFTDISTLPGTGSISWLWNFGDGTSSTMPSPAHNYQAPGIYYVTLIVTDNFTGCMDFITKTVQVYPNPVADFSYSASTCLHDSICFTDLSVGYGGAIVNYIWDFGGGNIINSTNPTLCHHYANAGNYIVSLTVLDVNNCTSSVSKSLTVFSPPNASFIYNPTPCSAVDSIYFSDLSSPAGSINAWFWDFDDYGNTSSFQNPAHYYGNTGVYDVQLIVSDTNNCIDTVVNTLSCNPSPVAGFYADTVCLGDSTFFQDTSMAIGLQIVQWEWDFGDTFTHVNNTGSVAHKYLLPGDYIVELIISNSINNKDTVLKMVHVRELPVLAYTPTSSCKNEPIQFQNLSTDIYGQFASWSWDFDNITSSSLASPQHAYSQAGTYDVIFSAITEFGCTDTIFQTFTVYENPIADFVFDSVCAGMNNHFTNLSQSSSGSLQSWSWDFGDQSGSAQWDAVHQYNINTSQTFDVSLMVESSYGCRDTLVQTLTVLNPMQLDFTFNNPCSNEFALFNESVINSGYNLQTYYWQFGNGSTADSSNPQHFYGQSGNNTVSFSAENQYGCKDTIAKLVTIAPIPVVDFYASSVCLNDTTYFSDLSVPPAGQLMNSWIWDFKDYSPTVNGNQVDHLYNQYGSYNVSLIATDDNGCKDTIEKVVEVHPLPLASFSYATECLFDTTQFTDNSLSSGGALLTNWSWDFGVSNASDDTSDINSPSFVYPLSDTFDVQLIVIDGNQCKDTADSLVFVRPLPQAGFSSSYSCIDGYVSFQDTSQTLISDPVSIWSWNFGDTPVWSAAINPSHVYNVVDTSFVVTHSVQTQYGCKDTTTQHVYVRKPLTADFSHQQHCVKDSVFFTPSLYIPLGNIIDSVNWRFGDGSSDSSTISYPDVFHVYQNPDLYNVRLIVWDDSLCSDTIEKAIQIFSLPVAEFQDTSACFGDVMYFEDLSVSTNGAQITSWFWDFGLSGSNMDVSHAQDTVFSYPSEGYYTVSLSVQDALGCKDTIIDDVVVDTLPLAGFKWIDSCKAGEIVLIDTSNYFGYAANDKKWIFGDGQSLVTSFDSTLHQYPPYNGINNNYNAVFIVETNKGCRDTAYNVIEVKDTLRADFIFSSSFCDYDDVDFIDQSMVPNPYFINSYTWDFDDGSPNSTQQNPMHYYANSGNYDVTLSIIDDRYCTTSITKTLSIHESPVADFTTDSLCYGDSTIFTDIAYTGAGSNLISWDWDFDMSTSGTYTSSQEIGKHAYSNWGPFQVELIVENDKHCFDTTQQLIVIDSLPIPYFSWNDSCAEGYINFNDATSNPNGYTLIGWNYNFGDNSITSLSNPVHHYQNTGISYAVTLSLMSDAGCMNDFSDTVYVKDPLIVEFQYDTVCLSNPTQFIDNSSISAGVPLVNTRWEYGDGNSNNTFNLSPDHVYSNSGVYVAKYVVEDNDGCTDSTYHNIMVHSLPVADFSANIAICTDSNFISNLSMPAWSIDSSYWDFGDTSVAALSGVNSFYHDYLNPGTYNVELIVVDSNSCWDTVSQAVTKLPCVVVYFDYVDSALCVSEYVYFIDSSFVVQGYGNITSWLWDWGDGSTDLYSVQKDTISHVYNNAGTYHVVLTVVGPGGISYSFGKDVKINQNPVSSFSAFPTTTTVLDPVITFNDQSLGGMIQWHWDFGDGYSSLVISPYNYITQHKYDTAGSFVVSLVVVDTNYCVDSTVRHVFVDPEFFFYIPNAFTPNGDGKNDFFGPVGTYFNEETFSMNIYNRWGELVYTTTDYFQPWNGRYNGDICQEGSYAYIIIVRDLLNIKHEYKGYVILYE